MAFLVSAVFHFRRRDQPKNYQNEKRHTVI